MNSRKVNWCFFVIIILHIGIVASMLLFKGLIHIGLYANFIISEAIIVIPAFLFLIHSRDNWIDAIGLHKIKWSTAGMIILFTFLTMPLTTAINAFSMLFVENAMEQISGAVVNMPFFLTFFFMAVNAPVCEELVFRGVLYHGYRKSGTVMQAAILSAVLFALGHMNFNQAAYAFVIGFILVLLVETTGSILSSILFHIIFNGTSVITLYLGKILNKGLDDVKITQENLIYTMSVYSGIALVTTAIAACVLVWIAKNENRQEQLKDIFHRKRTKKERMITIPLILAIAICLAYMIAIVVLQ